MDMLINSMRESFHALYLYSIIIFVHFKYIIILSVNYTLIKWGGNNVSLNKMNTRKKKKKHLGISPGKIYRRHPFKNL